MCHGWQSKATVQHLPEAPFNLPLRWGSFCEEVCWGTWCYLAAFLVAAAWNVVHDIFSTGISYNPGPGNILACSTRQCLVPRASYSQPTRNKAACVPGLDCHKVFFIWLWDCFTRLFCDSIRIASYNTASHFWYMVMMLTATEGEPFITALSRRL